MKYYLLIPALWPVYVIAKAQKGDIPDWLKNYNFDPPKQCISNPAGPLNPRESEARCPLLVDDETAFARRSWHPWTYPPACVEAEEVTDPKLCVFTYTKLRGELGISLVTTPEIAAAGIGILDDPDERWEEWARGRIPLTVPEPPPYEVRDLKDKGMGVVANRTIRRDEVVMHKYPVIVRILDPRRWKQEDVLKLLHRAAVQLPPKEASQMMQLAHSKGGYIVDDIINTNAFGVILGDVDHSGLYLEVSRLNHACKPNMFNLPLNLLSEQRQALIREWGFNCTCPLCTSPSETQISDRRRGRIQDLLAELDRPEIRNHAAVKRRVDEILDLCDKEGLTAQVGDFYTIIAEIYSNMGDLDLARKYGELAVRELTHYAGYDHERTRSATLFLEKLRSNNAHV
ncbi:SET domain-containing protein [Hypoxylon sp. FL0543]|nr:SET domain-containing protein [Hypoxylon sp. FL0543]